MIFWGCFVCGRVWTTSEPENVIAFERNIRKAKRDGSYWHWDGASKVLFEKKCVDFPGNLPKRLEGELADAVESAWRLGGEVAALVVFSEVVCPSPG